MTYDVTVIGAYKSYGSSNVLNGLTMKIPTRSIYGLLGPSGCGKSTLIKCILGSIPLDFGCIDLKVDSLKKVGYMPQDTCLETTLTIKETFKYYGSLYSMNNTDIENRIDELNKFLILPNLNTYINKISGGQCRRVSLAITLLHDPKIIIFDEPTVGIDPVLRKIIWTEFTKMVEEQNKTIIITTHYIEEAIEANHVGLMRDGIIIDGGSPRDIFIRHGTNTLEEAFLKLCCEQKTNTTDRSKLHVNDKTKSNILLTHQLENKINLHRIKALLEKDYLVCSRDYLLIFTMIVLPILLCFIFCSSVGVKFKDMNIAIKNDEVNNILDCKHFIFDGCIFDENNNNITMSCVVMNYLESHDYKLVEVKYREDGEAKMNSPKFMGFLNFPKNYTKDLIEYINNRENYDNASRSFAHLTKENMLFVNQIETDVIDAVNDLLKNIANSCSYNVKQTSMTALEFFTVYGHNIKSYVNSTITIYIAILINYCPSLFGVSIMLSAKLDGVLGRSMFAGVKIFEFIISLFCIITALILVQMFTTCFIAYVILNNPIQITSGLFAFSILLLILGWLGFFFGVLSAIFSTSFVGGCNIITGSFFTQVLLSGMLWPFEGQPKLLRIGSELLPVRLISKTLNDIVLKGFAWNHSSIIKGTSSAIVYCMVIVLVLIVLGKYKRHWWIVQNIMEEGRRNFIFR
ncbi:AAA+ ATPase domain,P-loop containing nucleoside triphosphate hydrolase,ABC transporter-like,ABC [Cinara cedri]|uniref:AAA+ ATPase domain,P-loop containing nucleoside triphosphate hydrolase,ABC transporter-like,ABC n=1 Tax=Cinara cedri TaxID=506608 RepID=A0A5E4MMW4_9HEMI|nr:AAA+ ATPase domain,P-loop containing nucleoside triphosphate hydrolase,ABC transporter-like,ABC [Cinara cedri]